jgi:hypothetical protein
MADVYRKFVEDEGSVFVRVDDEGDIYFSDGSSLVNVYFDRYGGEDGAKSNRKILRRLRKAIDVAEKQLFPEGDC